MATFDPDSITQEKLHEWRRAAEHAWSDETRHEDSKGHPQPSAGQCYVTSRWIASKIGGYVGEKDGHYFAVSPDKNYIVDLTGDQNAFDPVKWAGQMQDDEDEPWEPEAEQMRHRPGPIIYTSAKNPLYQGFRIKEYPNHPRAELFAERANAALEGKLTKQADSGGSGSDAYPGQTPQAEEEFNQRNFHDPVVDDLNLSMEEPIEHEYKFIFSNGNFQVVPLDQPIQAGVASDQNGPVAVGHINVRGRNALWSVETNIGLRGLVKQMENYTKAQKWEWGGLVDGSGQPISEEFAGKKSYWYGWREDKLLFSERPFWPHRGRIDVINKVAHFSNVPNPFTQRAFEEWAKDFGYRLAQDNGAIMDEWQLTSNTNTRPDLDGTSGRTRQRQQFLMTNPRLKERLKTFSIDMKRTTAIDPTWLSSHLQKDPYLYHVTRTPFLDSIIQRGLMPGNQIGHTGRNWPIAQTPRSDHLYLGTGQGYYPSYSDPEKLRVHYQNLDPQKINPDEDYMVEHLGELGIPDYNETLDRGGSYGDWANENNFVHPDYSRGSLEQHYRMAYNGSISPQHLEIQRNGLWRPLVMPSKESSWRFSEYPGGTDMNDRVKNKEWPTTYDKGDPEADPGKAFEGEPQGELTCPYCDEVLPDFKAYVMHTKDHQDPEMQPIDDGHFPTIEDMDEPLPLRPRNVTPTAIPVMGAIQQDSWYFAPSEGWHFADNDGWYYHSTPSKNLFNIERQGLVSNYRHRNDDEFDEGPPEHVLYFDSHPGNWGGNQSAHLRVHRDDLLDTGYPQEDALRRGEYYLSGGQNEIYVPPEHLQVMRNEQWEPLIHDHQGDADWHFGAAGAGKEGKDLLQAPIPFIYDIEKDYITVGHPGMHTHEIMGQFTPGGIVEGYYEKGGKMVINTTTTIPWSNYHFLQLWYFSHPGLEVTSVEIENQSGERHKVASVGC